MKKDRTRDRASRLGAHPVLRFSLSPAAAPLSLALARSGTTVRRPPTCARDIRDGADESESAFDACAFIRTCGKL